MNTRINQSKISSHSDKDTEKDKVASKAPLMSKSLQTNDPAVKKQPLLPLPVVAKPIVQIQQANQVQIKPEIVDNDIEIIEVCYKEKKDTTVKSNEKPSEKNNTISKDDKQEVCFLFFVIIL